MHIETLMLAEDSVCSHGDIAKTILRFPTEPFHRYSIQVTTSPDGVHLSPGRIVSMIPPFISLVLQRKNPGYCDACRKQSLLSSFSPLGVFTPAQEPRKWPGVADTFQMISLRELSINQSGPLLVRIRSPNISILKCSTVQSLILWLTAQQPFFYPKHVTD